MLRFAALLSLLSLAPNSIQPPYGCSPASSAYCMVVADVNYVVNIVHGIIRSIPITF
jgi:hypothetical protein